MIWKYSQEEADRLKVRLRSATMLFVALVLLATNWLALEWGQEQAEKAEAYRERADLLAQLRQAETEQARMAVRLADHCEGIIRQVANQLGLADEDPLTRVVRLHPDQLIPGGIGGGDERPEVAKPKKKRKR